MLREILDDQVATKNDLKITIIIKWAASQLLAQAGLITAMNKML